MAYEFIAQNVAHERDRRATHEVAESNRQVLILALREEFTHINGERKLSMPTDDATLARLTHRYCADIGRLSELDSDHVPLVAHMIVDSELRMRGLSSSAQQIAS